jgi:hypothetical protein
MKTCSGGVVLAPMQPFGEPHEREIHERERGGAWGEEKRAPQKNSLNPLCVSPPPRSLLI